MHALYKFSIDVEVSTDYFVKVFITRGEREDVWEIHKGAGSYSISKNDRIIAYLYGEIQEPFNTALDIMYGEVKSVFEEALNKIKGSIQKLKEAEVDG